MKWIRSVLYGKMRHTRILLAFVPLLSCVEFDSPFAFDEPITWGEFNPAAKQLAVVSASISFQSSANGTPSWIRVLARVRNGSTIRLTGVWVSVMLGNRLVGEVQCSSAIKGGRSATSLSQGSSSESNQEHWVQAKAE